MGYSDISVGEVADTEIVDIEARGGSRRQRGAAIGAHARKFPGGLTRIHVHYSETYGFQTATYARYRKVK